MLPGTQINRKEEHFLKTQDRGAVKSYMITFILWASFSPTESNAKD